MASIAQFYYGDRSRSEVIWETNQLPPNPKPGSVLQYDPNHEGAKRNIATAERLLKGLEERQ